MSDKANLSLPWSVSQFEVLAGGESRTVMGADDFAVAHVDGRGGPENNRIAEFIMLSANTHHDLMPALKATSSALDFAIETCSELDSIRKTAVALLNELSAIDALDNIRQQWGDANAARLQERIDELRAALAGSQSEPDKETA